MKLGDLFDPRYGHSLELNRLRQVEPPAGVNYVSRAMGNNGVTARVDVAAEPAMPGELSVALGGNGVLSTFVQPEPFVCGRDVMILRPRDPDMSLQEKLWWATCIWENRYRFSYGRQANRTLADLDLPEPVPEWVTTTPVPDLSQLRSPVGPPVSLPPVENWGAFPVEGLFTVVSGIYIPAREKLPGATVSVTSSRENNGWQKALNTPPLFKAGSITVARNGSVGEAFYQPVDFFATDDVRVLVPKGEPLGPAVGLFVCRMLRSEQFRYSYGRKWTVPAMKKTLLLLPQTGNGQPDWELMEKYMKSLPLGATLDP